MYIAGYHDGNNKVLRAAVLSTPGLTLTKTHIPEHYEIRKAQRVQGWWEMLLLEYQPARQFRMHCRHRCSPQAWNDMERAPRGRLCIAQGRMRKVTLLPASESSAVSTLASFWHLVMMKLTKMLDHMILPGEAVITSSVTSRFGTAHPLLVGRVMCFLMSFEICRACKVLDDQPAVVKAVRIFAAMAGRCSGQGGRRRTCGS